MVEFKVEVPIKISGDKGGRKIGEQIADQIKKSLGSIGIGKGVGKGVGPLEAGGVAAGAKGLKMGGAIAAILAVLEGMSFIIKPIMSLLKIILMLLFLPLVPILKPTMQALAAFIKWFAPVMKKVSSFIEKTYKAITDFITALVLGISGVLGTIFKGLGKAWEVIKGAGMWIWEKILKPSFDFLKNAGSWIWEMFVQGLNDVLHFGIWLWEIIKKGFGFWIDIGEKLWNFIKSLFTGTISVGKKVWDYFKSFFKGTINVATTLWNWLKGILGGGEGRAAGGPVSGRRAYLVGERGPEIFAPGTSGRIIPTTARGDSLRSITIQINNPSVRSEVDIKKISNEVSRVLQRKMSGRIAQ